MKPQHFGLKAAGRLCRAAVFQGHERALVACVACSSQTLITASYFRYMAAAPPASVLFSSADCGFQCVCRCVCRCVTSLACTCIQNQATQLSLEYKQSAKIHSVLKLACGVLVTSISTPRFSSYCHMQLY